MPYIVVAVTDRMHEVKINLYNLSKLHYNRPDPVSAMMYGRVWRTGPTNCSHGSPSDEHVLVRQMSRIPCEQRIKRHPGVGWFLLIIWSKSNMVVWDDGVEAWVHASNEYGALNAKFTEID
jgi:hypothetical protein